MSELIPIKNLRPFTKFCMTIGALPSSYLVSTAYEEQLLWLCDYLQNTVIPTVNNNADAVSKLQNLYLQLKQYVDNYFDNLDVQEEINNKLDEMAEDGTLANIINQDIFNELNEKVDNNTTNITNITSKIAKADYIFKTVSDMKQSTILENGNIAQTLGYFAENDGGGAFYTITNTLEETKESNEMDIVELSNSLYAIFVPQNSKVNPLQFGCKGDGTTNDTSIFQYAVNYASDNKLTFFTPAGRTFLLDSIIFIEIPKIELNGVIKATSLSNTYTFDYDANNFNNNIYINEIMQAKLVFLGLNSSKIRINRAYQMLLTTDTNEERRHNFIAYNQFDLGFVNQLEIYPANPGVYWINENIFYGGRIAVLNMHTDSDFSPSENIFYKCMSEDTNFTITNGNGNKFYDIRMENFQKLDIGDDTVGNIFTKNFGSTMGGFFVSPNSRFANLLALGGQSKFQNNGGKNTVLLNSCNEKILFNINYYNNPAEVPVNKNTLNLQYQGQFLYQTELMPIPNVPVGLNFEAGNTGTAYGIKCYDENKQLITDTSKITTSPLQNSPLFGWTSIQGNTGYICNSSGQGNQNLYWAILNPKTNVKFIQLFAIGVGTSYKATRSLICRATYYQEPDEIHLIETAGKKYKANT